MPQDYSEKLQLLRELYERVQKKETVEDHMYTDAGVKVKARLKDIEKEISATKKKVSHAVKREIVEEEEKELEELAKENNMTVEEFKASIEEKKTGFTGADVDFQARKFAQERGMAEARAKKNLNRAVDAGELEDYGNY